MARLIAPALAALLLAACAATVPDTPEPATFAPSPTPATATPLPPAPTPSPVPATPEITMAPPSPTPAAPVDLGTELTHPGTLNLTRDDFAALFNEARDDEDARLTPRGWDVEDHDGVEVASHYFTGADEANQRLGVIAVSNPDGTLRSVALTYVPSGATDGFEASWERLLVLLVHGALFDAVASHLPQSGRHAAMERLGYPTTNETFDGIEAATSAGGIRFRLTDQGHSGIVLVARQDNLDGSQAAPPPPLVSPPPAPPPVGAFEDIELSGQGNRVERFSIPEDAPAIATLSHRGSSGNFIVWALDQDGRETELLANAIGRYSGTRLLNLRDHAVAVRVQASGRWTITISDVSKARTWDGRSGLRGSGDDVIMLETPPRGLATVEVSHAGRGNFIVWAYDDTTWPDLMVNEIGRHHGQTLMPSGTLLLEIQATGEWGVEPN